MPVLTSSAPGKIILSGEHAVVYGHPAIAFPVPQVRVQAFIAARPTAPQEEIQVISDLVHLNSPLASLKPHHPIRLAVEIVKQELRLEHLPAFELRITSTIPVGSGLGSSAATAVAVVRAVSGFLGAILPDQTISDLAFRVEKQIHGSPSGIDNTVTAFNHPVYFVRGEPILALKVPVPLAFVIGDTGISSSTRAVVDDVRRMRDENPTRVDAILQKIGALTREMRAAMETGRLEQLGALINANHNLLAELEVSSPQLERLVAAARAAGAQGAKLSGSGRGGNMIAYCLPQDIQKVEHALLQAGAAHTIRFTYQPEDAGHAD